MSKIKYRENKSSPWKELNVIRGERGEGVPVVTEEDNGKILRVVDGVWTAVELPSAEGVSF